MSILLISLIPSRIHFPLSERLTGSSLRWRRCAVHPGLSASSPYVTVLAYTPDLCLFQVAFVSPLPKHPCKINDREYRFYFLKSVLHFSREKQRGLHLHISVSDYISISEEVHYKELAQSIMETDKFKICRAAVWIGVQRPSGWKSQCSS